MKKFGFLLILCALILSSCEKEKEAEFNYSLIPGTYTGWITYLDIVNGVYIDSLGSPYFDWSDSTHKSGDYTFNISIITFKDHYKISFDKKHKFQVPDLEIKIIDTDLAPHKQSAYFRLMYSGDYTLHPLARSGWLCKNEFEIVQRRSGGYKISFHIELDSRPSKHRLEIFGQK